MHKFIYHLQPFFSDQAIFLAHGPSFKTGHNSSSFVNVQVYDLMCSELTATTQCTTQL